MVHQYIPSHLEDTLIVNELSALRVFVIASLVAYENVLQGRKRYVEKDLN